MLFYFLFQLTVLMRHLYALTILISTLQWRWNGVRVRFKPQQRVGFPDYFVPENLANRTRRVLHACITDVLQTACTDPSRKFWEIYHNEPCNFKKPRKNIRSRFHRFYTYYHSYFPVFSFRLTVDRKRLIVITDSQTVRFKIKHAVKLKLKVPDYLSSSEIFEFF